MPTGHRRAREEIAAAMATLDEAAVTKARLAQLHEELDEQLAWASTRHDVEMRTAALRLQLDRALAHLQSILARYDQLHAEGLVSACAPSVMIGALQASAESLRSHCRAVDPTARAG